MVFTRDKLLEFFRTDLAIDTGEITDDTQLFSSGIVDSFALVSILTFVETEAKIRIAPADVNLANFDTIESTLSFVQRAQA